MKIIWIAPASDDVLTTAVERGLGPFLFQTKKAIDDRKGLAQFKGLYRTGDEVLDEAGVKQGRWMEISSGADQDEVMALAGKESLVVMSARDWQVIPAENLIAGLHLTETTLLAHVTTAAEARTMFESLELGTDGVVLETGASPVNGFRPDTISYRTTPNDQMSARVSTNELRACSGLM